jgi:plasmid stabilization system protein ParE
MTYRVVILRRAQEDTDALYAWLAKRSVAGAGRWYRAFLDAVASLNNNPSRCGSAPESVAVGYDIRQHLFKTPRGRKYRLLFLVTGDEVRILRIRGPRQAPVTGSDLSSEPE